MRPELQLPETVERSFIDKARRAQIIACTIDAIAERGFKGSSLMEIARRAGISKGVISYHFAGKSELIQQVVEAVYGEAFSKIFAAMERERTAAGKLHAYIRENIDFMRADRKRMQAMVEVFLNFRRDDGSLFYDPSYNEAVFESLEAVFAEGHDAGEFRPFDRRLMAISLQGALDSLLVQLASHEEIDLDSYAAEMIDLFDRATRADGNQPDA